ncbi:MAG: sugar phosphate isomerase/epimerase, partial [Lutimonas sp.]
MKKTSRLFKLSGMIMSMLVLTLLSCGEKQKEASKDIDKAELVEVQEPFFKLSLAQWSLNKAIRSGELS